MKEQTTKLPWIVSANLRQPIITDGHKTIAEIVNHEISNVVTKVEAESNSKLIVSAVNSHASLMACRNLLIEKLGATKDDDGRWVDMKTHRIG